ncbi:MAG: hypothetical protein ACRAUR_03810 [Acinetobacter tandoii]
MKYRIHDAIHYHGWRHGRRRWVGVSGMNLSPNNGFLLLLIRQK